MWTIDQSEASIVTSHKISTNQRLVSTCCREEAAEDRRLRCGTDHRAGDQH